MRNFPIRRRGLAAALAVVVVAPASFVLLEAGSADAASGKTVVLKGIMFGPRTVTIKKGQSVTWSWKDGSTKHNVTPTGKLKFKGAGTRGTGTYRFTFKKAGVYKYECTLHLGMTGQVIVK